MDAQSLLYNAAQMPVTELESFIHQLNALVTRKCIITATNHFYCLSSRKKSL
jgi:hypothetical protein